MRLLMVSLLVLIATVAAVLFAQQDSGHIMIAYRDWTIESSLVLFVVGWAFQFVGHAAEGKPPEFIHDWRYLFVGLRWWIAKFQGKA